MPPGFTHVPFNDLAALEEAVDETTCAVLLEPIQGEGGVYVAEMPYLKGAREICSRKGALLVLDEVQTGMGRTGALFAHEHYGVTPDVMTVAKGLAGGLPIGAVLASAETARGFVPGDHGSTFGGNPVVCAAALAVLMVLRDENLIDNAARVGGYFKDGLLSLQQSTGAIKEVRGMGLMLAAELEEGKAKDVVLSCLERGYVVNNIGENILRFLPPLSISTREVDGLLEVLGELLAGSPTRLSVIGGITVADLKGRDFVSVSDLDAKELLTVLDAADAFKSIPHGGRGEAEPRGQDRRPHIPEAVHAHQGILRGGGLSPGRPPPDPERLRAAARPGRDHRGHGKGTLALRPGYHPAHLRPRGRGGAGAGGGSAGDQRPYRPGASLPDTGRPHDGKGAPG